MKSRPFNENYLYTWNQLKKNSFFANLSSCGDKILIKNEVIQNLTILTNKIKIWFPHLSTFKTTLFATPYDQDISELPDILKEEFIDLISNSVFKQIHKDDKIEEFWTMVAGTYPTICEYALHFLVPFASTYLCECAFSSLLFIKNKHSNKLDVEPQLVVAKSKIEPRIYLIGKKKFS